MMIDYLGNECVECGAMQNLEFDHIDPTTKSFEISNTSYLDGPLRTLLDEVRKCQLLCKVCHDAKSRAEGSYARGGGHNKIIDPQHGTAVKYNKGCRCELCADWKRKYRAGEVDSLGNSK